MIKFIVLIIYIKKYDLHRYELLKKKYNVTQSNKLIFRFNRYSKKSYIIKY